MARTPRPAPARARAEVTATVSQTLHGAAANDPIARLATTPFCELPDLRKLSVEQQFALHEFQYTVLAAAYKLYQTVPQALAAPIIRNRIAGLFD